MVRTADANRQRLVSTALPHMAADFAASISIWQTPAILHRIMLQSSANAAAATRVGRRPVQAARTLPLTAAPHALPGTTESIRWRHAGAAAKRLPARLQRRFRYPLGLLIGRLCERIQIGPVILVLRNDEGLAFNFLDHLVRTTRYTRHTLQTTNNTHTKSVRSVAARVDRSNPRPAA